MSHTASITRQLNTENPHRRVTQMIMLYTDPKTGKRESHMLRMGDRQADAFLTRTLRWASYNGVEVIFRPA